MGGAICAQLTHIQTYTLQNIGVAHARQGHTQNPTNTRQFHSVCVGQITLVPMAQSATHLPQGNTKQKQVLQTVTAVARLQLHLLLRNRHWHVHVLLGIPM